MKPYTTVLKATLTALILAFVLAMPATAQTPAPAQVQVPAPVPSAQISPSEREFLTLQHKFELLQKDFERLQSETDRDKTEQSDRMSFQDQHISDVQTNMGWAISILAIMLAVFSIATLWTSSRNAKKEAAKSAKQWMDDHAPDVSVKLEQKYIEPLEVRLEEAEQKINSQLESATDKHDKLIQILEHAQDVTQNDGDEQISDEDKDKLREAAKDAKVKPEEKRTFMDWSLQAVGASLENMFAVAANAYDQVARAEGVSEEQIAQALVNKGIQLRKAGLTEDALAAFEEVEKRFGGSKELALRKLVANALVSKGGTFRRVERLDEAIGAFDAVEVRFGAAAELALREQVANARGSRGFVRLILAKKLWQLPECEKQAKGLLKTALDDTMAALGELLADSAAFGNKGYILFLLGREAEAEAPLRRALELGGKKIYEVELYDAKIHRLPQDQDFIALVERVWAEVQAARTEGEGS